ncbi:MAG: hypothetical protein JW778_06810 [Candidatus Altiarchaeota archaeon]|nr:hypothetical protein [Candidatus Altiarchaeota archaeon]
MGLLDKIKKKKEEGAEGKELPSGKPLTVKSEEEFLEKCRGLTKDFRGVLLLSGDVEGERYSASLIIDKGSIIASTFEFDGLIMFREQAINEITGKLKGSKGILNIFEFDDEDMRLIRDTNKSAFLSSPVPLSSLGLKIKLLVEQWVEKQEGEGARPLKLPELFKTRGTFNLLELARSQEKIKETGKKEEKIGGLEDDKLGDIDLRGIENLLGGGGAAVDIRKLEELKRIKEERQRKIAEKLAAVRKGEGSKEKPTEGKRVQTTIDKLYSLVRKYKKLRIDDKLAHTLGVNRAQIEEWAVILEEHDLIELRYPTIGEPEIRVKGDK